MAAHEDYLAHFLKKNINKRPYPQLARISGDLASVLCFGFLGLIAFSLELAGNPNWNLKEWPSKLSFKNLLAVCNKLSIDQ